jgi:hypothetical protein
MKRAFGTTAVTLLVMLAITACAAQRASSPPTAIGSIADIAGTWTGTLEFGAGDQPATLTIDPGGRATLVGRTMTVNGQVSVRDGKGTYDFPGRSNGVMTLYGTGAQRQLHLKGQSGVFEVWVTPGTRR